MEFTVIFDVVTPSLEHDPVKLSAKHRCNLHRVLIPLTMAAGCLFTSAPLGAMVIDEFETVQTLAAMRTDAGVGSLEAAPNAAIVPEAIGGEREIITGIVEGGYATVLGANRWGEGQLTHSARAGARTYSLVIWDGEDDGDLLIDPVGLGGINFVQMNLNAFCIRLLSSDHPAKVTMTVYSAGDTAGGTRASASVMAPKNVTQLTDFFLPFESFQLDPGSLDIPVFSNVGAIVLKVEDNGENSLDLAIENVEAMLLPEPPGLQMALLGVIGMAVVACSQRRRGLFRLARAASLN